MCKEYKVGYFEGYAEANFQILREFETQQEALKYICINYYEDDELQTQNVALMYEKTILFDGRYNRLN